MENVNLRISEDDRRRLEEIAATLTAQTGAVANMTDAFGYLLRTVSAYNGVQQVAADTGRLTVPLGMMLRQEQLDAVDAVAQAMAVRKSQLLGGAYEPVRSEGVRYIIRSGYALTLTEHVS